MKAFGVALGVCCVAVLGPPAARANPIGIGAGTARAIGAQSRAGIPNDVDNMINGSIEVFVDDYASSAGIRLDELGGVSPVVFVFRQDGHDAIERNEGHPEHGGPGTASGNVGHNGAVVTTPAVGSLFPTADQPRLPGTIGAAISAIPEPGPLPLLATGVAVLFLYRRRPGTLEPWNQEP